MEGARPRGLPAGFLFRGFRSCMASLLFLVSLLGPGGLLMVADGTAGVFLSMAAAELVEKFVASVVLGTVLL